MVCMQSWIDFNNCERMGSCPAHPLHPLQVLIISIDNNIDTCVIRNLLFTGTAQDRSTRKRIEVKSSMGKRIKQQYNESQVEALYAGLDHTPLILIQGPPGTGKTHAILGLLSVILQCSQEEGASSEDNESPVNEEISLAGRLEMRAMKEPWKHGLKCPRYDSSTGISDQL